MIPTLNQSKCLRMLEEWAKNFPAAEKPQIEEDLDAAFVNIEHSLTFEAMTELVLLSHLHGVIGFVYARSCGGIQVCVQTSICDPPSLTKLRRRAHKDRLLGAYAKERKGGRVIP